MRDSLKSDARFFDIAITSLSSGGDRVCSAVLDSVGRDVSKPLATILGAAAGLQRRGSFSPSSVDADLIETIQTEASRLERFVSILLDMAKLQTSCIEPRATSVALADIVGMAVNDAAGALRGRRADIRISTGLPLLRVDPAMLRRVLFILIENAAAQSPDASTIGIHAGSDRKAIRIQILDEGDGIPTNEIARLFEQFGLPSDDQERRSGGMQLAVCRGYVEAMGGAISGSNRSDGGGSVFTITLPLAD